MDDTRLATNHKKILLLINPNSRFGDTFYSDVEATLRSSGHHIIGLSEAERGADPNDLIRQYQSEIDCVVVGGGDGSVNKALPSLVETQKPLLVLPLGTANNLARTFNLPTDLNAALELLSSGKTQLVDLGQVNGIFFVNVAGLGLSTEINRRVSAWLKRRFGVFAFILTAFQIITKMNPFRAIITCDGGQPMYTKCWQISICNGRHYGAGMTIEENATLTDAKLHCLSTEVKKWWQGFFLVPSLLKGRYKKEQDLSLVTARELTVETRRKFYVDVDGDILTTTPATFRVLPKVLNIIVPEEDHAIKYQ